MASDCSEFIRYAALPITCMGVLFLFAGLAVVLLTPYTYVGPLEAIHKRSKGGWFGRFVQFCACPVARYSGAALIYYFSNFDVVKPSCTIAVERPL
jgi:hypothetical protein